MIGWCHDGLNEHEFEQTPRDGEGQGSLACCSPWNPKELDMTEQLNNNQEDRSGRSWESHVLSCILLPSIWFYFSTDKSFNNYSATDCQGLLSMMRSLSTAEWQVVFIQNIVLDQLPRTTPHAYCLGVSSLGEIFSSRVLKTRDLSGSARKNTICKEWRETALSRVGSWTALVAARCESV